MSMTEWAKREVELACARERGDDPEDDWDYGGACYESALKAFESLCGDGHSGASIGYTKHILNRLIDGKPLTPIEDTEDVWCDISKESCLSEGHKAYQCKRMSSLFKDIYPDGRVEYRDIEMCYCVNINNPDCSYHSGLVRNIVAEKYPVEMPYFPNNKPIKVVCEDFLVDPKNGDFDTVGIFYAIEPDGSKNMINRYFKEDTHEFVEIGIKEYKERYLKRRQYKTEPHTPTPEELEDVFREEGEK